MIKQTHTYANLPVSADTYAEIRAKLIDAGYIDRDATEIPMQGIALVPAPESTDEPIPEDTRLRDDIQSAINRVSAENGSNTPDFILAQYLVDCLTAYDKAVMAREKWYGREQKPLDPQPLPPPDPVGKPFFTSI
jgi:hypothetical protein